MTAYRYCSYVIGETFISYTADVMLAPVVIQGLKAESKHVDTKLQSGMLYVSHSTH